MPCPLKACRSNHIHFHEGGLRGHRYIYICIGYIYICIENVPQRIVMWAVNTVIECIGSNNKVYLIISAIAFVYSDSPYLCTHIYCTVCATGISKHYYPK